MRTILYNADTGKVLTRPLEGGYRVDGQPRAVEPPIYELQVIDTPAPDYDRDTQRVSHERQADLSAGWWVTVWTITAKTPEEIEAERKAQVPSEITPRQFRVGLVALLGIAPDTVDTMLDGIEDATERTLARIAWEYSIAIERQHPLVTAFAAQLGLTERQVDDYFTAAAAL
jgi:hypothetical protein